MLALMMLGQSTGLAHPANGVRTHLALDKDTPLHRSTAERPGVIATGAPKPHRPETWRIGGPMPNRAKTGHSGVEHNPVLASFCSCMSKHFSLRCGAFPRT